MPMHDWRNVPAGIYHALHGAWITHLQEALNGGLLPPAYYALGEQRMGGLGPDLLTLHVRENSESDSAEGAGEQCGLSIVASPPKIHTIQVAADGDNQFYLGRQRRLVIRHVSGDRVAAIVELVSPANRHSGVTLADFASKVIECLTQGIHVVVVDLFPPGLHDPAGIHDFIWRQLIAGEYTPPADKPLTLVSYAADSPIRAYIEPLAVGDVLADLPLFISRNHYVPLPLEKSYQLAWQGMPERWRKVVADASPSSPA